MQTPEFLSGSLEVNTPNEIVGEPAYTEKIGEIREKALILKKTATFATQDEAVGYIKRTPINSSESLIDYIPETTYVLGDGNDGIQVWTFMKNVEGTRLDSIDFTDMTPEITEQLDDFILKSLVLYQQEGICPGINYKNFIIDNNGNLWYVDSEPYPENNHEPFEISHARESRLKRDFGENADEKFPKTWEWINENRASNYKKAKGEAEARRRQKVLNIVHNSPPVYIRLTSYKLPPFLTKTF